ncbi:unnamed protein product [Ranitomeya imitator]|uniref:Uncharacterized protein n=1 Tax=Ranitomeya imitator TaxID=111125 RepID=A0ABN9MRU2_9NEOB|nr:unnamed protein product [Ranitomeya imitator]
MDENPSNKNSKTPVWLQKVFTSCETIKRGCYQEVADTFGSYSANASSLFLSQLTLAMIKGTDASGHWVLRSCKSETSLCIEPSENSYNMQDQVALLAFVTIAAVLEQAYFSMQVIWARRKYKISPPNTTGHPTFDRIFRAHEVSPPVIS